MDIITVLRALQQYKFVSKRMRSAMLKTPDGAYWYARIVVGGPTPLAEDMIAKGAKASYNYATHIIHGPFPKGEPILKSTIASGTYSEYSYAFYYAKHILKLSEGKALQWRET